MTNNTSVQTKVIPLVSFPKSGNTWVRFLLANALKRNVNCSINYKNINHYTPAGTLQGYDANLLTSNAPCFLKAHQTFNITKEWSFKFDKVIYIVRDPLDMLWSYYHFINAQKPDRYRSLGGFTHDYDRYCGHWGHHVISWVDNDQGKDILLVKYEELKKRPECILKRILAFSNIPVADARINHAVESSCFQNMKTFEGGRAFMKAKDEAYNFVRSAVAGEGRLMIPDKCARIFFSHSCNRDVANRYQYYYITPSAMQRGIYCCSHRFHKIYSRIKPRLSKPSKNGAIS